MNSKVSELNTKLAINALKSDDLEADLFEKNPERFLI